MELTFEWDEEKAKANLRKHKVSFEEAKIVFNDPFLWTFPDPEHFESEERYIHIGRSLKDESWLWFIQNGGLTFG